MVDNRGISPISAPTYKAENSSKTSEEKYSGNEYFAQEMQEEETQPKQEFQDRSAQLRASLNGLAMANAGSIMLMKTLKEKEREKNKKIKDVKENASNEEEVYIDSGEYQTEEEK